MGKCGCRILANQYGSQIRLCQQHSVVIEKAAKMAHQTSEEFVNQALLEYLERVRCLLEEERGRSK